MGFHWDIISNQWDLKDSFFRIYWEYDEDIHWDQIMYMYIYIYMISSSI